VINSKRKGKLGELEWCEKVRAYGFDCVRGVQYRGMPGSPDTVSEQLSAYHFEVKRRQTSGFYLWMAQAEREGAGKIPVVAHRKDHGQWHVFLKADDFLELIKASQT